ncbi:hypothetical protein BJ912DRAFT_1133468 [Pholiota molesta]|nr:hypothetical protein BJ912DRAFT_1133468 [Pholiota molesta]
MNLTSATSASDGAKARLFGRLRKRYCSEKVKKEAAGSSQTVWEKRLAYVDLKRKFPSLNDKIGDELLVDKESRRRDQRLRATQDQDERPGTSTPLQAVVRPKEKAQQIREAIKSALSRQKDLDIIGRILSTTLPNASTSMHPDSSTRAVSMRVDWSRRRRILLDAVSRRITPKLPRSSLFGLPENDEDKNMDVDDPAEAERLKRLEEQWKYDATMYLQLVLKVLMNRVECWLAITTQLLETYRLAAGANMNLKLPAARQLQWMSSPMQRPASVVNGIDGR